MTSQTLHLHSTAQTIMEMLGQGVMPERICLRSLPERSNQGTGEGRPEPLQAHARTQAKDCDVEAVHSVQAWSWHGYSWSREALVKGL